MSRYTLFEVLSQKKQNEQKNESLRPKVIYPTENETREESCVRGKENDTVWEDESNEFSLIKWI